MAVDLISGYTGSGGLALYNQICNPKEKTQNRVWKFRFHLNSDFRVQPSFQAYFTNGGVVFHEFEITFENTFLGEGNISVCYTQCHIAGPGGGFAGSYEYVLIPIQKKFSFKNPLTSEREAASLNFQIALFGKCSNLKGANHLSVFRNFEMVA